jgi:hypothetical protein
MLDNLNAANRYLLIDCRSNPENQRALFIQGALNMPPSVLEEIHTAVQLSDADKSSLIESLSPEAASILALLWSCCKSSLHFCLYGDGIEESHYSQSNSPSHSNKVLSVADIDLGNLEKPIATSDTQFGGKGSSTQALESMTKFKKNQSKHEVKLPQFRLATALLMLGFSRVSVIRGYFDTVSDGSVDDIPDIVPNMKRCLQRRNDGFCSLLYNLHFKFGAPIDNGVVKVCQDILIAEKVRRFYLSSLSKVVSRSNNAVTHDLFSSRLVGISVNEIGNMLRSLSGFKSDFLESILQNNFNSYILSSTVASQDANPPSTQNKRKEEESEKLGPYTDLINRASAQSEETGEIVSKSVNELSGKFSKTHQDLLVLKNKFIEWKRGFDIVSMNVDGAFENCKKFTSFSYKSSI